MLSEDELIEKVKLLNQQKKNAEVIELLTDEILEFYKSDNLYAEKAQAHYRLQENECCKKAIEKALLINPFHAKAIFYKGNLYKQQKDYVKAIELFNKAIEVNPKYAYPYNGLGNIYKEQNRYAEAIENYGKAIDADSTYAYPYNGLGNIYKEQKQYAEAIKQYNKAIEADPKYANPYNGLANAYANLKDYNKAIELYHKAIKVDPKYAYPYNGLGNVFKKQKEYLKANELYNKAIEFNPKFPSPYNGLGNVYYALKDLSKAIKLYNKAIEVDPKFLVSYYNIALVYYDIKKFPVSLENFEKYIKLVKSDQYNDYYISIAQSRIAELKKLIEIPEYSSISELVSKIKTLLLFKEDCITHYTSLTVAKELILKKSLFRLSEGTFLNDTSEGRELFKFLSFFEAPSKTTNDTVAIPFVPKPFIGSFVAEHKHDNLTLWRMYGKENKEEARGCAITLERDKLLKNLKEVLVPGNKILSPEMSNEEFDFYRVAYKTEFIENPFVIPGVSAENVQSLNILMGNLRKKVKKFNSNKQKNGSDIQDLLKLLNRIAYLFKSAEYQYEHELRLVVKDIGFEKKIDTDTDPPKAYIELVAINPLINKITLGPKVERADEWAAAFYYNLDKEECHPEILISHLPFK